MAKKEQKGVIYILTNPSFPDYIKIGYAHNIEQRLKQLNRSETIPYAFRVYAIYEVEIPREWIGKSIIDINIRQKYGINILGIKKNGRMDGLFAPNEMLNADMTLLVLGEIKSIEKCFKL